MAFQTKYLIWGSIAAAGIWYLLQPHSYEDCVMDGMSNAKTESAMYALRGACRKKFPSKSSAAPAPAKDLLHVTPPFPDLKTPPKVMTELLGFNLGDKISDLVYKFGNKTLTKDDIEKITLIYKGDYFLDFKLNQNERVAFIYMSCANTMTQTALNGLYCGNDEGSIKMKFGSHVVTNCIQDEPTMRVAYIPKYNTAYYLEATKIIGLAVTNITVGTTCK